MEHSKEPWIAKPDGDPQWKVCHSGSEFAVVCLTSQSNDEANAKRIVACVNACQGIPTEALERFAARGGILAAMESTNAG